MDLQAVFSYLNFYMKVIANLTYILQKFTILFHGFFFHIW